MPDEKTREDGARQFTMRPEPQPMPWARLRSPERNAVGELLKRLKTVLDAVDETRQQAQTAKEGPQLATSFLVSGERGTGKTTVLLSTKYAIESQREFFDSKVSAGQAEASPARERATLFDPKELMKVAGDLEPRIKWLPAVDMELFPPTQNPLTTLLVRVRDALLPRSGEPTAGGVRARERVLPECLVEEGLDDPWAQIENLIEDATLMWDRSDVPEARRQRVERQIEAVDTYARFGERFRSAVKAVTNFLSAGRSQKTILVLPIDNADRSADHLFQILKLLRMTACSQLWYVIAASQSDIDVFVERSYREELKVGELAGASASEAAEQIRSIARRQAATTQRTVLPPAHRINVERINAIEALEFTMERGKSLGDLLATINVEWPQAKTGGAGRPQTLRDLVLLDGRLSGAVRNELSDALWAERGVKRPPEEHEKPGEKHEKSAEKKDTSRETPPEALTWLSLAGMCALTLPLRSLVDLWQSANYWAWRAEQARAPRAADETAPAPGDKTAKKQMRPSECDRPCEYAVYLAHDALATAIAESELPEWADRVFRTMIFTDYKQNVCLDFRHNPIRWKPRYSLRTQLSLASDEPRGGEPGEHGHAEDGERDEARELEWMDGRVSLHDFYGYALELRDPKSGASLELPARVRGWLMLLHDLLTQLPGPRVSVDAATRRDDVNPTLVHTEHVLCSWQSELGPEVVHVKLSWPMPVFDTFDDFELVAVQWRAFLQYALPLNEPVRARDNQVIRLSLIAWMDNIQSVVRQKPWRWRNVFVKRNDSWQLDEHLVLDYELQVCRDIDHLHERVAAREVESELSARTMGIRTWLEDELALLFMPEYVWDVASVMLPKTQPERFTFAKWWTERLAKVRARRYFTLRDAVRDSVTFSRLADDAVERERRARTAGAIAKTTESAPTLPALTLLQWADRICHAWFEELRRRPGDVFRWTDRYLPPRHREPPAREPAVPPSPDLRH